LTCAGLSALEVVPIDECEKLDALSVSDEIT
jgi:hypothetical protein